MCVHAETFFTIPDASQHQTNMAQHDHLICCQPQTEFQSDAFTVALWVSSTGRKVLGVLVEIEITG